MRRIKFKHFINNNTIALLVTMSLITITPLAISLGVLAAPDPDITPYDEARIWQATRGLVECDIVTNGFYEAKKTKDIDDGEIFRGGSGSLIDVGSITDVRDGKISCIDGGETNVLYNIFGKSGTALLSDMGVYSPQTEGEDYIVDTDKDRRRQKIYDYTKREFGVDVSDSSFMSRPAQYIALKTTFDTVCKGPEVTGGFKVIEVDENTGDSTTKYYNIRNSSGDISMGPGIEGGSNNQGTKNRMKCSAIADKMNDTAEDYAKRIKNLIDAGVATNVNTSNATPEDNSCESNSGVLGWIMCPVAGILDSTVGFLDDQIKQMLFIKASYFEVTNQNTGQNAGKGLKDSWTVIRNIAYTILIPIMLVMVIGTALGMEVFSAYTVKKALPRMVIAIIFIALSWYVCRFLVDFFNIIGLGVRGLITSPFDLSDVNSAPLKTALHNADITSTGGGMAESFSSGAGLGVLAAGGLAIGFATGAVSIGILISTFFTAALILGGIFLLLVARQMIIIALVMIAPLAILAWIFPGNDKMWKMWWGSFSKLLMLYPLIMLLIGVGQVFAQISGTARIGENRLVTVIIIVAAYVMPFFFIPFAFKWAGGVFGNIAGMVNDKERGVLDRLKKGRSENRAKGWQGFKTGTGNQFGQRNKYARGVGTRVGVGAGNNFGFGGKGREALDHANRNAAIENVMKSPAWNGMNQNDDALMAATYSNSGDALAALTESIGAERAQKAVNSVKASVGFGRPQAIAAAQQLVSTGTGYKDMPQMVETLARASGGNASTASALAGFANSETKKVGRHDLAPGYGTLNELVQTQANLSGTIDPHSGERTIKGSDGSVRTLSDTMARAEASTTSASSVYELVNGKPQSIENQARAHARSLEATSGASEQERMTASAFFKELEAGIPNAKGGNRDTIRKILDGGLEIENASGDYMENLRDFDRTLIENPTKPGDMILREDIVRDNYVREYRRPDPNNI